MVQPTLCDSSRTRRHDEKHECLNNEGLHTMSKQPVHNLSNRDCASKMSSYRGRPSKGCDACRLKKIKCDEGKPACTRCKKSRQDCRYRDQTDLVFRNQTAFAAQKAEESWRKRSRSHQRSVSESVVSSLHSTPLDQSSSSTQHSVAASSSQERYPAPLLDFNGLCITPLQNDLRRLAYERFVYDFVVFESPNKPSDEPTDAMWDFIPYLYEKAGRDSCLAATVDAVSYGNFASRCNAPHALPLAEECAARSIKLLQATIADKSTASSNDALCSVYLMGLFGTLIAVPQAHKDTLLAHNRGAKALLQLRNVEEYYADHYSTRLFELTVWQVQLSALHHAIMPPISTTDIAIMQRYIESSTAKSSAALLLLVHRETQLHAAWHELKHGNNPPSSRIDLHNYIQSALQLDADFTSWERAIPRGWRYHMELNTAHARATYDPRWRELFLGSPGAPKEIHSYSKLKRCWAWIFYRTTHIIVLRDLLEMLNWMFKLPLFHNTENNSQLKPMNNASLQVHHAFATTNLVNVIEKGTSAMFGIFNAFVYGKMDHDLIGLRGYMMIWPLGVMDAVLKLGFIPDSANPITPPSSGTPSPHMQGVQPPYWGSSGTIHDTTLVRPDELCELLRSYGLQNHAANVARRSYAHDPNTPHASSMISSTGSKQHLFDSSPTHPFDLPTNMSYSGFPITKPASIDVAARREWLNRILYFISSEMGIKTAIAVPAVEVSLEVCRKQVEELLAI
ncbi:unnamed protein product [Periconia digitata]|uniref:Zn(2)-C6 fungal-type domain-containing protein n=1 Tax=Periconia digitata TaxID=1303443 RepID=A0A9W4XXK2_9PLEO|nr:unnamed protein product [Periconia digitata]